MSMTNDGKGEGRKEVRSVKCDGSSNKGEREIEGKRPFITQIVMESCSRSEFSSCPGICYDT